MCQKIQSQKHFAYNFPVLKASGNLNEKASSYTICMTSYKTKVSTGMQTSEEQKEKSNNLNKI